MLRSRMGRVFRALGMSVGRVLNNNHGPDKQAAFDADVTYVTASDLAWLYLSDNTSVMNVNQLVRLEAFLHDVALQVLTIIHTLKQKHPCNDKCSSAHWPGSARLYMRAFLILQFKVNLCLLCQASQFCKDRAIRSCTGQYALD